ncbi:activator of stress genes 1 [Chaetomidium leptoderma]|uniref:Activator of stress genes 1 n=1 Tax=Chaetomidium leptoderma TaxID=669021 RepID=A0AAN6VQ78_9PEZI|nr:activator of stress genes 1 [Chaetomidium leptoderma]
MTLHRREEHAAQHRGHASISKQRVEALEDRLAVLESMLRQKTRTSTPPQLALGAQGSSPTPPFRQISGRFALWKREECTKVLTRTALSPLTAEASELHMVEESLDNVCAELPFLCIPWFREQIRRPDAVHVPDAWWQGLTYATIASAAHFRTLNSCFRDLAVYAWAFFRNAYAVLPELLLRGDSLGAAQAVMAMAMFVRQSTDTRTTSLLLSIAIRMQHSAGLHVKTTSETILPPAEVENRSRLLWAAFILDMDISVNSGLPPVHADQGVTLDLPGLQDGGQQDMVFRLRAELAGIQRRIGSQLFNLSQADLLVLESELGAWSLRVPLEIRPNLHDQQESSSNHQAADVSVAMLHLVYYNSLAMVCWASLRHAKMQMLESPQATDSDIHGLTSRPTSIARAAARAAISSLLRFPTESFADLWKALCYPVSASIVLLAVVCKEPTHPEARGDLSLLARFVEFLDKMVRDEGCDLQRMRDGISTFEKVATHAVRAALGSDMPVNPALWPLSMASGQTGNAIAKLLTCTSYHPMYLTQSFMGNTPNRDTDNAKQLAAILGLSWGKNGYGPFAPDSLMPATHGFAFGSGSPE